jgi:hypothetical protein
VVERVIISHYDDENPITEEASDLLTKVRSDVEDILRNESSL